MAGQHPKSDSLFMDIIIASGLVLTGAGMTLFIKT